MTSALKRNFSGITGQWWRRQRFKRQIGLDTERVSLVSQKPRTGLGLWSYAPEGVSHSGPVIVWRSYAQVRTLPEIISAQGTSCQGQIRRSNQNSQRGTLLSPKSYRQRSFLRKDPEKVCFSTHSGKGPWDFPWPASSIVGSPPVGTGGRAILIVSDPKQTRSDEQNTIRRANHKCVWKPIFLPNKN